MEKALFGNDNTITKEIIEKLTKENTGMYEKLEPYADMGTKYLEFKKIIATKIRRINRLIEERKIVTDIYNKLNELNYIKLWYFGHFHQTKIEKHEVTEFHLLDVNEFQEVIFKKEEYE